MSKKRTPPESSNDEPTNEGLGLDLFQQDDNAKRARLVPLYDTTLQDLPIELIECILVKAIAMEVKGTRLAKSVWKEKADPVISRLRAVCSQWNYILTTNFFRCELKRTLDALETTHMEILLETPLILSAETWYFPQVITMKDEIFVLYRPAAQDYSGFNVYDRNNMAEVKAVIPLQGICPTSLAACSVSNCLYILDSKKCYHISILRIKKEDEHQFNISPFIGDMWMPNPTLSVTANGCVIVSNRQNSKQLAVISVYDANGSLQHKIRLSSDTYCFYKAIPKSNGNLVLVSANKKWQAKLTEIDMDGTTIRQYQSSISVLRGICNADKYGRIVIAERLNGMELLDSEFNLLDVTGPQLDQDKIIYWGRMHYNSERNEVVAIVEDDDSENGVLTIFHFTEE